MRRCFPSSTERSREREQITASSVFAGRAFAIYSDSVTQPLCVCVCVCVIHHSGQARIIHETLCA